MSSPSASKAVSSPSLLRPAQFGIQAITYASLDGATYTLRLTVDVPEGIRGKASCSRQQASPKNSNSHIPPDVVGKLQFIDIVEFILRRIIRPNVVEKREMKGSAAL